MPKKLLSRMWRIDIDTGSGTPVWTQVKGLSKVMFNVEGEHIDTTDMDSNGWGDEMLAANKFSLEIDGRSVYTGTMPTVVEDPGQAALKAKGLTLGDANYANVRWYRTDTKQGYSGQVSPTWKGAGGAFNEADPFTCVLKGSGAPTAITVP